MKKGVVSILLAGLAILDLAACTPSGLEAASTTNDNAKEAEAGAGKEEGTGTYWVGKTLNNSWWISTFDFTQQTTDNLGVDLTIVIPREEVDLGKQVSMIGAAIEKKADAIVASATSSDGMTPTIKKARETGIKIVNFDTRISDTSAIDAFAGGNDVVGTYKAGKYIYEQLGGEGEVVIIIGPMEQSTGTDRHAGLTQACAGYPGIGVVAEQGAEWSSDKAADVTVSILTANPNVKAIFACNDQMAVGMVNTAKVAGEKVDDPTLVGYNGALDAVNMIMDGNLDVFVSPPNLGESAMGAELATVLVVGSDYHYDREILYDCTLVTGEFVDGLIDQTIYEYAAEWFPLRGLTGKGY